MSRRLTSLSEGTLRVGSEEIKSVPIISVRDEARPAAKKAKPKRANIVVISFLLGCVVSTGYVVAVNRYKGSPPALIDQSRRGGSTFRPDF